MLTTITSSLLKQNSYHLEHMFSLTNIRSLLFQKSPSHCSLPPWGLSDHLSSDWTFKEALDRLESNRRFHDQIRTSIACIWQCAGDHLLYLPPPLTDHQIRTYNRWISHSGVLLEFFLFAHLRRRWLLSQQILSTSSFSLYLSTQKLSPIQDKTTHESRVTR